MLLGNQMERALINAGLADAPKPRKKPRHKKFTCHVCGEPMVIIEGTNTMACSNEKCKQYFIFDN
jgi:transcription elongation factor Elf1